MRVHKPLAVRFAAKVQKTDGCWIWQGATKKSPNGTKYGMIVPAPRQRPVLATRVSWSLHHGKEWPYGMFALHTCDRSICVNPDHIFPGTLRDNVLDALSKGRKWGGNNGKTHCIRGHAFDASNTIVYNDGKRHCRACRLAYKRKRSIQ